MNVKEAAERLECSVATVYQLCSRGKLGHYRVGARGRGAIRITEEHVAAYRDQVMVPVSKPRMTLRHLRLPS